VHAAAHPLAVAFSDLQGAQRDAVHAVPMIALLLYSGMLLAGLTAVPELCRARRQF
jgi:hypothetical protein